VSPETRVAVKLICDGGTWGVAWLPGVPRIGERARWAEQPMRVTQVLWTANSDTVEVYGTEEL